MQVSFGEVVTDKAGKASFKLKPKLVVACQINAVIIVQTMVVTWPMVMST